MGTLYQFGAYLIAVLSRFAPLAWADKNPAGAKKALDAQKRVTAANPTPENEKQTLLAQSKFARTAVAYLAKKAETAPPAQAARLEAAAKRQGQDALKAEQTLRTVHNMNISPKGKILARPSAKPVVARGATARGRAALATLLNQQTAGKKVTNKELKAARAAAASPAQKKMAAAASRAAAKQAKKAQQAANPPTKTKKPKAPKKGAGALPTLPPLPPAP